MKKTLSKTLREVIVERSNDYSFLEEQYGQAKGTSLLMSRPEYNLSVDPPTVSVVIPAYNVRNSILACLTSIEQSNFNINHQNKLQVVVVEDGSIDDTWEILKQSRFSMHLTVVKQVNHGQAQALNTGVSVAEGDTIIFCDADMVLSYYAIDHFVARHQQIPNILLAGFRMDVPSDDPRVDPNFIRENGSHNRSYFVKDERIVYPVSGWPNNMCLASNNYKRLGYGRGLWMPDDKTCEDPWLLSDLVIGALFSISREVFLNIGGYDERLHGWGSTDGLLAAKAISYNQFILPVYAASGLHINHPFRTTDKQIEYARNRKKFFEIIKTDRTDNYPNWIGHAKDRIIKSLVKSPTHASLKLNRRNINYEDNEFPWNEIDSLLAIGEYSRAYAILSTYPIADNGSEKISRMGKALLGMEHYQEAVNILRDLSISNNFESESTINLSIAYAALGKFTLARESLKKLSNIHPQTPGLSYWYQTSAQEHIKQGNKYFNQEFYDTALRCFEAALIADPINRTAIKNRDQCMIKLKN